MLTRTGYDAVVNLTNAVNLKYDIDDITVTGTFERFGKKYDAQGNQVHTLLFVKLSGVPSWTTVGCPRADTGVGSSCDGEIACLSTQFRLCQKRLFG